RTAPTARPTAGGAASEVPANPGGRVATTRATGAAEEPGVVAQVERVARQQHRRRAREVAKADRVHGGVEAARPAPEEEIPLLIADQLRPLPNPRLPVENHGDDLPVRARARPADHGPGQVDDFGNGIVWTTGRGDERRQPQTLADLVDVPPRIPPRAPDRTRLRPDDLGQVPVLPRPAAAARAACTEARHVDVSAGVGTGPGTRTGLRADELRQGTH